MQSFKQFSEATTWEKKTKKICPYCESKNVVKTYKEYQQMQPDASIEIVQKLVHLCKDCHRAKIIK